MNYDSQKARQIWQNMQNNAQGHIFESCIESGCDDYSRQERAEVEKTPEPFRVTQKGKDGKFEGRFIANAQPDFKGTLIGGRAIVFEAKHTTTPKIHQNVITETQWRSLDRHQKLGALVGVCAGIGQDFFFVPWDVWKSMKLLFGHKYATAAELSPWQVRFDGSCLFLDYRSGQKVEEELK